MKQYGDGGGHAHSDIDGVGGGNDHPIEQIVNGIAQEIHIGEGLNFCLSGMMNVTPMNDLLYDERARNTAQGKKGYGYRKSVFRHRLGKEMNKGIPEEDFLN